VKEAVNADTATTAETAKNSEKVCGIATTQVGSYIQFVQKDGLTDYVNVIVVDKYVNEKAGTVTLYIAPWSPSANAPSDKTLAVGEKLTYYGETVSVIYEMTTDAYSSYRLSKVYVVVGSTDASVGGWYKLNVNNVALVTKEASRQVFPERAYKATADENGDRISTTYIKKGEGIGVHIFGSTSRYEAYVDESIIENGGLMGVQVFEINEGVTDETTGEQLELSVLAVAQALFLFNGNDVHLEREATVNIGGMDIRVVYSGGGNVYIADHNGSETVRIGDVLFFGGSQ
jgi:hypothetical protein